MNKENQFTCKELKISNVSIKLKKDMKKKARKYFYPRLAVGDAVGVEGHQRGPRVMHMY